MPDDDAPVTQWAALHGTKKFLYIQSLSGYRRSLRDEQGYHTYVAPKPAAALLGAELLKALNRSRFIDPDEDRGFFEMDRVVELYERWVNDSIVRYEYKSRKQLFDHMSWCVIWRRNGEILMRPHRWVKAEYWKDLAYDKDVIIPATTDVEQLGVAAELALSRCK